MSATYTGWPSILLERNFPFSVLLFSFPMSFKGLVTSKTLFLFSSLLFDFICIRGKDIQSGRISNVSVDFQ